MPKFEKLLREETKLEWKEQYINYKKLKKYVKLCGDSATEDRTGLRRESSPSLERAQSTASSSSSTAPAASKNSSNWSSITRTFTRNFSRMSPTVSESSAADRPQDKFVGEFWNEVKKVDTFYEETVGTLKRDFLMLFNSVRTRTCTGNVVVPATMSTSSGGGKIAEADDDAAPSLVTPLIAAAFSSSVDDSSSSVSVRVRRGSSIRRRGDNFQVEEEEVGGMEDVEATEDDTKEGLVELYRQSQQLKNFGILNYTACVKILKKWDKMAQKHSPTLPSLSDVSIGRVREASFAKVDEGELQNLILRIERTFASLFTHGDAGQARGMLLARRDNRREWMTRDWQVFSLGMRLGLFLMLACWFVWDCAIDASKSSSASTDDWDPEVDRPLLLIKVTGCVVIMYWLWGINLYCWTHARIHYMYILELQQMGMKPIQYVDVFDNAISLSMGFLVTLIIYFKVRRDEFFTGRVNGEVYVYFYCAFVCLYLCRLPKMFWITLYHCFTPFFPSHVRFRDTMMGDLLTSTVKLSVDLANYISKGDCPIGITATFSAVPLLIRFVQNLVLFNASGDRFPYLLNALKYAMAEIVVIFGVFHATGSSPGSDGSIEITRAIFIAASVLSTLYTYAWDIRMDWRLGKTKFAGLRRRRLYSRTVFYYLAIVLDFFLRFLWVMSLAPKGVSSFFGTTSFYLDPFLGAIELCRRGGWAILRLESQQVSKHTSFRSIGAIPLNFTAKMPKHSNGRDEGDDSSRRKCFCFERSRTSWLEITIFVFAVLGITIFLAIFF